MVIPLGPIREHTKMEKAPITKRAPRAFVYKDLRALGVKNKKILRSILKECEKLTEYEKALLRGYL